MQNTHAVVVADDLRRTFLVRSRRSDDGSDGTRTRWGTFRRRVETVTAVDGVSLRIDPGEIVGFLGPNGAGKTTTLKMFAGLLHPTGGQVRVNGFVPARRAREHLRSVSLVMGQRQQLVWDIPVADSFELNRVVYKVSAQRYRAVVDELVDLLDLGDIVRRPVRTLSLGQRMRCELAVSLIHTPTLVFLDEPTLGLDVEMQRRIRQFIKDYNARHGATIVLTSHYMADVEELCPRVVLIHHGRIVYDGARSAVVARLSPYKRLRIKLRGTGDSLDRYGDVVSRDQNGVALDVPADRAAHIVAEVLSTEDVADLTVTDPSLEDVLQLAFQDGALR